MLEVTDATFRYRRGGPNVLEHFSFESRPGVNFLLGPNGAGKSTLLKLVAGVLRLREGEIRAHGVAQPPRGRSRREWGRTIGWVPQEVERLGGFTVVEQAAYCGWLKGLPRDLAMQRAAEVLEKVGLTEKASERATTLSGGQARRLQIASALTHDSSIILMDEPTAGLDPVQRDRLHEIIKAQDDVQWIISTHQTEDLAEHASHVHVIDTGRTRFSGTPEELLEHAHNTRPTVLDAYRALVGEET